MTDDVIDEDGFEREGSQEEREAWITNR